MVYEQASSLTGRSQVAAIPCLPGPGWEQRRAGLAVAVHVSSFLLSQVGAVIALAIPS